MSVTHVRNSLLCAPRVGDCHAYPLVIDVAHRAFRDVLYGLFREEGPSSHLWNVFTIHPTPNSSSPIEFVDFEELKEGTGDIISQMVAHATLRRYDDASTDAILRHYSSLVPTNQPSTSSSSSSLSSLLTTGRNEHTEKRKVVRDKLFAILTKEPRKHTLWCPPGDRIGMIASVLETMCTDDERVEMSQLPRLVRRYLLRLDPLIVNRWISNWVAEPIMQMGALAGVFVASFAVCATGSDAQQAELTRGANAKTWSKYPLTCRSASMVVYLMASRKMNEFNIPTHLWDGILYAMGDHIFRDRLFVCHENIGNQSKYCRQVCMGRLSHLDGLKETAKSIKFELSGVHAPGHDMQMAIYIASEEERCFLDKTPGGSTSRVLENDREWSKTTVKQLTYSTFNTEIIKAGHLGGAWEVPNEIESGSWSYLHVDADCNSFEPVIRRFLPEAVPTNNFYVTYPATKKNGERTLYLAISTNLWHVYAIRSALYYTHPRDRAGRYVSDAYRSALSRMEQWERFPQTPLMAQLMLSSDPFTRCSGFAMIRDWYGFGSTIGNVAVWSKKIVLLLGVISGLHMTKALVDVLRPLFGFVAVTDDLRIKSGSSELEWPSELKGKNDYNVLLDPILHPNRKRKPSIWRVLVHACKHNQTSETTNALISLFNQVSCRAPLHDQRLLPPDFNDIEGKNGFWGGRVSFQRQHVKPLPKEFKSVHCNHSECYMRPPDAGLLFVLQTKEIEHFRNGSVDVPQWCTMEPSDGPTGSSKSSQCFQESIYPIGCMSAGTLPVWPTDDFYVWTPVVTEALEVNTRWPQFERRFRAFCNDAHFMGVNEQRGLRSSLSSSTVRHPSSSSSSSSSSTTNKRKQSTPTTTTPTISSKKTEGKTEKKPHYESPPPSPPSPVPPPPQQPSQPKYTPPIGLLENLPSIRIVSALQPLTSGGYVTHVVQVPSLSSSSLSNLDNAMRSSSSSTPSSSFDYYGSHSRSTLFSKTRQ